MKKPKPIFIKVRWICEVCGYKSHWFEIRKEDYKQFLLQEKYCYNPIHFKLEKLELIKGETK